MIFAFDFIYTFAIANREFGSKALFRTNENIIFSRNIQFSAEIYIENY